MPISMKISMMVHIRLKYRSSSLCGWYPQGMSKIQNSGPLKIEYIENASLSQTVT